MVTVRVDPWLTDYGASAEAEFDPVLVLPTDTSIETVDWSRPIRPAVVEPEGPVFFTDGVLRTEVRLLVEDGDRSAWGLAGTYAVGAVRVDGRTTFDQSLVEHLVVVNGGVAVPDLRVPIGRQTLTYRAVAVGGQDPLGPGQALQNAMRDAEVRLAASLVGHGLVIADGTLHHTFGSGARVLGVAKRMHATYLTGDQEALITRLVPGERSPLFAMGRDLDRFSWYQRLMPLAPTWHRLAGLVRCEVRSEVGAAATRSLADLAATYLPRFASRPGHDPRAPQNLVPIGALERHLRARMGHPVLLRRGLEAAIATMLETPITATTKAGGTP